MMEFIGWFCEKHPLLMGFLVSLAVMAVLDSEVVSSILGGLWALIGCGWFFYLIAKEGIDL